MFYVILHETRLLHVRSQTPFAVEFLATFSINSHLPQRRLQALFCLKGCVESLSVGSYVDAWITTKWDRVLTTCFLKNSIVFVITIGIVSALCPFCKLIVIRKILLCQGFLLPIFAESESSLSEKVYLFPSLCVITAIQTETTFCIVEHDVRQAFPVNWCWTPVSVTPSLVVS